MNSSNVVPLDFRIIHKLSACFLLAVTPFSLPGQADADKHRLLLPLCAPCSGDIESRSFGFEVLSALALCPALSREREPVVSEAANLTPILKSRSEPS